MNKIKISVDKILKSYYHCIMEKLTVNGGVESRHAVTQRKRHVADRDSNWYSTLEPKKQTVPFAALAIAGVAPGPLTLNQFRRKHENNWK